MSTLLPQRPTRLSPLQPRRFAIVASQYNPEFVDALVEATQQEIEILVANVEIIVHRVPGAFEIPVLLQEVALKGGLDAIIALGVIIQGSTAHAELIGRSVTDALQDIALRFRIPVIHEVLLVQNEEQARERTLGSEINRGQEAARVAVMMSQTMAELKI